MVIAALLLLVLTTAASASSIPNLSASANRLSNSLSALPEDSETFNSHEWTKISQGLPERVQRLAGSRVELECVAVGSPPPRIQWLRSGSAANDASSLASEEDIGGGGIGGGGGVSDSYDRNLVSPSGDDKNQPFGKTKSRLVINAALRFHEGDITCQATSGWKTAKSTTSLQIEKTSPQHLAELVRGSLLKRSQPRIVLAKESLFVPIGSDVLLPCQAVGEPKPNIFWLDADEQLILGNSPRFTVGPDGSLSIASLEWNDMGDYKCIAKNEMGQDTETAFVYPYARI